MMVVDASAILAVVLEEPDAEILEATLADAPAALVSAVNYWEILVRAGVFHGSSGASIAEQFMAGAGVEVAPVDRQMASVAADAFARFGPKSSGGLNLGDCFAYALAAREGDGLLFKGNDFPKTDVKSVL